MLDSLTQTIIIKGYKMLTFKKAFILGAVAVAMFASSSSYNIKRTPLAEETLNAVLGNNVFSSQGNNG